MNNHSNSCLLPNMHHDHNFLPTRRIFINGPIIIGAGPSGLAVAAGLKQEGVPFLIIERSNCIASLWQNRTYNRLKLHLPKQFCQLPYISFPHNFPKYPSKDQFIDYLKSYAKTFDIDPRFNETVRSAKYNETCGLWRVTTVSIAGSIVEYLCRWIVVASGENTERVMPEFEGMDEFVMNGKNIVMHVCDYKSGEVYKGKRVLVVGCGNSGMEVSLDLCHHGALPFMVVRSSVHVLPREIFGKSTFEIGVSLTKLFPIRVVDRILVFASRLFLGNIENYGLKRPCIGPLELKNSQGKTPVLDIGTLSKIRAGDIKIVAGIKKFCKGGVELVNGEVVEVDHVILATGYCSNVPSWLKENESIAKDDGFPNGLYTVGFTGRGLSGASMDAIKVAKDIAKIWKEETKQNIKHIFGLSCTSSKMQPT